MVQLTFRVPNQNERRIVSGELVSRDPLILSEPEKSRPDWRVNSIGHVDLISAKAGIIVHDFGDHAVFTEGYCQKHDVMLDDWIPDRCPYCQEEERIEAERREMQQRRHPKSVDDPAPRGSYDAW